MLTSQALAPRNLRLAKIRINGGGYDDSGTYYGLGAPVYVAHTEDGDWFAECRARSRDDAKAQIVSKYPGVTFYR